MIGKDDRVVTAFAEYVSGPGWANMPVWVVVQDGDKKLRLECIQPEDQTERMKVLFTVSNATHGAMVRAVEDYCRRGPKKSKK